MRDGESRRSVTIVVFLLVLYLLISTLCFAVLRGTLMGNANALGSSVTSAYAQEIDGINALRESFVAFAASSIDQRVGEGWSGEQIDIWAQRFFQQAHLQDEGAHYLLSYGDVTVTAEGSVDGRVTAPWYDLAISGGGDIVYSPVYIDQATGQRRVAISCASADGQAVSACVIPLDDLSFSSSLDRLNEGTSIFIVDQTGSLIAFDANWEASFTVDQLDDYTHTLMETLEAGYDPNTDSVIGIDGLRRNLHYSRLASGWYTIVTVPIDEILGDLYNLYAFFALVFVLGLIMIVTFIIRDGRAHSQERRLAQTLKIISGLYYALYRIDWRKGTYEMLKGSREMRQAVPQTGAYELFLDQMEKLLDASSAHDFRQTFSLANIQRLVDRGVKDFGGDIMRVFDGHPTPVNVLLVFDESLDGEVILCFRIVEKERQRQLREHRLLESALESARKGQKAKELFFSTMSHDMRTPLGAIMGSAALAERSLDDRKKLLSHLKAIGYSANQLLDLVNDILEMGRLEQGGGRLQRSELDLVETVRDIARPFQAMAEAQRKSFKLTIEPKSAPVKADAFRLAQILNNLLSNAFKFTDEEVGVISLTLEEKDKGSSIPLYVFTISDNGLGMSEDFLSHIWEPYARETRFSSRQIAGTGLGMPIVHALVGEMEGSITVNSRLKEGTTFTLTLPLERSGEPQRKEEAEDGAKADLKGLSVLVAEDNELNMEIVSELLEMEGVAVDQAWNGEEAVLKVIGARTTYDCILMDMQMPVMDGLEATRKIREAGCTIPIYALTANAYAEDLARCREAGMDGHLTKPIDIAQLMSTLDKVPRRNDNGSQEREIQ